MIRGLYQNIFDNPILTRELRRRMRGKALIFSIIGYIIIMTVTAILILITSMNPFDISRNAETQKILEAMVNTGQLLFSAITVIQALLVIIIAPTITAGMTTMEKERKTFDFLRVTTITPWMYIMGCFLSTIFYVSLALLCALPLLSLSFLYGGVSRQELFDTVLNIMGISMLLSSLGLFVSSIRERTRTAQGIIVFLIFVFTFGGLFVFNALASQFGVAALGNTTFTLPLGITVSGYVMLFLIYCFLSFIFLLMATRKLFDPYDARAVNHWQFAVIFAVVMGTILIPLPGVAVSNFLAISFMSILFLFIAACALNFAVGRMEVGDEIWHMKRLFAFLRPVDQTVPYLVLFGFAFFWTVDMFLTRIPAGHTVSNLDALRHSITIAIAGYLFFCFFGRFATALTVGRKGAGRLTLGVMIALWIIIPVISSVILSLMKSGMEGSIFFIIFENISRLSPFFVLIDGLNATTPTNQYLVTNLYFPIIVYLSLAFVTLIIGEPKRYKRWKGHTWHFDMPSG